jgi:carbamoylphosphate synthase small subunit
VKLPFGNRGQNQPVLNRMTDKVRAPQIWLYDRT